MVRSRRCARGLGAAAGADAQAPSRSGRGEEVAARACATRTWACLDGRIMVGSSIRDRGLQLKLPPAAKYARGASGTCCPVCRHSRCDNARDGHKTTADPAATSGKTSAVTRVDHAPSRLGPRRRRRRSRGSTRRPGIARHRHDQGALRARSSAARTSRRRTAATFTTVNPATEEPLAESPARRRPTWTSAVRAARPRSARSWGT